MESDLSENTNLTKKTCLFDLCKVEKYGVKSLSIRIVEMFENISIDAPS